MIVTVRQGWKHAFDKGSCRLGSLVARVVFNALADFLRTAPLFTESPVERFGFTAGTPGQVGCQPKGDPMNEDHDLYNLAEACRRLSISDWTGRQLIKDGLLEARMMGRESRIPPAAIQAYIESMPKANEW